nr:MAG TPA: hypothetical protein [Caudoviricetes sp.]
MKQKNRKGLVRESHQSICQRKTNVYIMVYHVRMVFVMNVKYTMKGVGYRNVFKK